MTGEQRMRRLPSLVGCVALALVFSSGFSLSRAEALYDLGSSDLRIEDFAGRHIALMGDSVTRYQYMSLVYFLEYGAFPSNEKIWATPAGTEVRGDHPSLGEELPFMGGLLQPHQRAASRP